MLIYIRVVRFQKIVSFPYNKIHKIQQHKIHYTTNWQFKSGGDYRGNPFCPFLEFLEEELDEVKFRARIFFDICCPKCQDVIDAHVNAYLCYHRGACRKICRAPRIDAFHWHHSLILTMKWVITADVTILPSSTLLISFHPPSRLIKRRIASSCGHSKIMYRGNTSASVEFRSICERVLPQF